MSPTDLLALYQAVPEREREYALHFARLLVAGKDPVEAAKAIIVAYTGENAADELLRGSR